MRPPPPFRVVRRLAETLSTMDEAHALAGAGAPEGAAVRADRQTGGRGRAGRAWTSPVGGLYLSVVLRPSFPPARWGLVPIAAGVALCDALAPDAPRARLKWPNDVLVDGRKLAGVLCEARAPAWAVVGLGVNAAVPEPELPAGATSLAREGASVDADALAARLLGALRARVAELEEGRGADVRAAWEARCGHLGARVRVGDEEGVAERLADHGALVLRRADGVEVEVVAGDVEPYTSR